MNLTLAIPTHNDQDDLCRLLARAAGLDLATHVLVVDDGSDVPLTRAALQAAGRLAADQLTLLRHETPLGPGVARNLALEHVPTDHMLFMDADDLPTRALVHLLADLDRQDFDFCLFQHHDTRMEREHSWGLTPHDQILWRAAGVAVGALTPVGAAAAAQLSRTANYPWNKIYRTAFLRDNPGGAIGCSPIIVHEDIELHWRSFLGTVRILASDRVGVIHVTHEAGARLTNRTGPERLAVFDPLERIAAILDTDNGLAEIYARPFFGFALGLFDWISGNLHAEYQARLNGLVQDFLRAHVPPALLADLTAADPGLVARIQARRAP